MRVTDYHAGLLRHRVTVQREATAAEGGVPDGRGGRALQWVDVATRWAGVTPTAGREALFAQQLEAVTTHRVLLRWESGYTPTPAMRVMLGARAFNVRAAINVEERNRWWVLFCDEGTAT